MEEDEVLAAGLADDPGKRAIAVDAGAHTRPERLKRTGRPGEVDARQVFTGEGDVPLGLPVAWDELDDAVGQTRLAEQLHAVPGADHRRHGGLPQDHVAHQRGRRGEVHRDGQEVERGDRQHEAFEGAILGAVPDAGRRLGLHRVDLLREVHVEPEEVDQLARRVDLRLVASLRLAEHARRVDAVTPRTREHLGGAQEDRRAIRVRHGLPRGCGSHRAVDRLLDVLRRRVMHRPQHVAVVVGHHHVGGAFTSHVPSVDHRGDVELLGGDGRERSVQLVALRRTGRELQDRFVLWGRSRVLTFVHREQPIAARRPVDAVLAQAHGVAEWRAVSR